MEVICIKKILAWNWPIGICLHCVRTLLWFVPTMSTLQCWCYAFELWCLKKVVKMMTRSWNGYHFRLEIQDISGLKCRKWHFLTTTDMANMNHQLHRISAFSMSSRGAFTKVSIFVQSNRMKIDSFHLYDQCKYNWVEFQF